jgi:hypothetical protein
MLAAAAALAAGLGLSAPARAQSIEPRLYSNAPAGINFLIAGYSESSGGVVLDPSIPLEDAHVKIYAPFIGYARSLSIAHRSGQIQVVVPYAWLSGQAVIASTGEVGTRDVNGFGDPAFRFAVNLHGAPSLSMADFRNYRPDLVVGVSLWVSAPLGQYDPTRLINLGTNRWTVRPEFGLSKTLGRFILEASGAVNFYTENDDFFGGQHLSQAPVYSAQGHAIYSWDHGAWAALDATYYTGGRTTVNGVEGDNLQSNWRLGMTLALPINRRNSIKILGSDGVSVRTGEDFVLGSVAWQYRWGVGL